MRRGRPPDPVVEVSPWRKRCGECEKWKPETDFYWDRRSGRYRPVCKDCTIRRNRRWQADHADRFEASQRKNRMRVKGLTPSDYDEALTAQGGRCAICGVSSPIRPAWLPLGLPFIATPPGVASGAVGPVDSRRYEPLGP